jgi:hypothetical protein
MLATYTAPLVNGNGVSGMNTEKQLRPDLQAIVKKILSLRALTERTGFFTHRDIGDLLRPLPVDDLVAVSDALNLKPREMPHKLSLKK